MKRERLERVTLSVVQESVRDCWREPTLRTPSSWPPPPSPSSSAAPPRAWSSAAGWTSGTTSSTISGPSPSWPSSWSREWSLSSLVSPSSDGSTATRTSSSSEPSSATSQSSCKVVKVSVVLSLTVWFRFSGALYDGGPAPVPAGLRDEPDLRGRRQPEPHQAQEDCLQLQRLPALRDLPAELDTAEDR